METIIKSGTEQNFDILNDSTVKCQIVRPGMVLASDILVDNTILAKSGTVLDARYIEYLRSRGITTVKIKTTTKSRVGKTMGVKELDDIPLPKVIETARFCEFKNEYVEHCAETGKLIKNISYGGIIAVDELVNHTNALMVCLNNKNDILSYLTFMDGTDDVTFGHSVNVSLLCNLFGQWLGMGADDLKMLTVAGMLHDVGKTMISDDILTKEGKLTDAEFLEIKKHPTLGYKVLQKQDIAMEVQYAALMHHEKIDGSGYPLGISGNKINKIASIVTICDIYDAMTSDRSYRKKICPFKIIDTFENKSYGELHTEYLMLFLKNIAHTFKNNQVLLSNGLKGEVVFIDSRNLSRPIVEIETGECLDLNARRDIDILEVF